MAQIDTDVKRVLPQRRAGASSETSMQDGGASAAQPHLIGAGEVQVTSPWRRIDFSAAFTDPIVIANTMSPTGGAPAVIRIRQVGPTGFAMRVQRWHDAEGEPLSAVFEVHSTTGISRNQWHNLAFLGAFETPPTLLAEVQGPALGSPLTVRWDVKDTNGVGVTLDARAGAEEKHDASIEVVGYIALQ